MKFGRWPRCAAASAIVVALVGLTRGVATRVFIPLPSAPAPQGPPASIAPVARPQEPLVPRAAARHPDRRAGFAIDHVWASAIAPRPGAPDDPRLGPDDAPRSAALRVVAAPAAPGDRSASVLVTCRLDAAAVNGVADALQSCIDHAPPYAAIEIPEGVFVLDHQVVVSTPLTLRTAGSADGSVACVGATVPPHCAVLVASNTFADNNGLLFVLSTSDVHLEHIVIDGNNLSRLSSPSAVFCVNGFNTYGFNASVLDCVGCALDDVVSRNALCGTGMLWSGGRATIQRSEFRGNGIALKNGLWADGLTLVYAPESNVTANSFIDNSDVALILGYGVNSQVEHNVIIQRAQSSFAGLMLHNFHSDDLSFRGDFRGAVISNNTIDCGSQLCTFGIQLGPRPWDDTRNIVGGTVADNDVIGAKVGINVDGAGSRAAPTTVVANAVTNTPTDAVFSGCAGSVPTDKINVAPTSVVNRGTDAEPVGTHLSYLCQLSSALEAESQ